MTSLDDVVVADAVTHAYNLHPSNHAVERYAEPVIDLMLGAEKAMPSGYRRTEETFLTDWSADVTTSMLFEESQVDYAVFHPQSITIFEDGLTALPKAERFVEENPGRSAALASVDIIGMDEPAEELERQVDRLDAHGVKVYPSYWTQDGHEGFLMDDEARAFPLWERAAELGLDVVAVHKAVPFGDVPMEPYGVEDVEDAAACFPELNFEIVHGGFVLAEETGWQVAKHDNVYVNLEITAMDAALRPDGFVDTMESLCWAAGEDALDRIVWGSGTPQYHPRLLLEAFWGLDYPEMESRHGTYAVTEDDKRRMLGANLAEAHGLDLDAIEADADAPADAAADDEGTTGDGDGLAEPYSTTPFEVVS